MLHDLLKVKEIREKSANDEVLRRKRLLAEARQTKKEKEQALVDYIEWRCKEEQALYDNILNTDVRQNDLDMLKQKVALLREKDATLEQAIEAAKNDVAAAEKALKAAQEAHHKAQLAVEKFEEFTRVLDEEAAREAQRLEEIEMEEFSVRPSR